MPASWLVRKRKGELLDLAKQARIPDVDTMLKDDLVDALQERLEKNENIYAKSSTFSEFYERYGSPIKRERSSPAEDIVKPTRRRQTITAQVTDARRSSNTVLPDSDGATPEKSLVTRTPRAIQRIPSRVSQVDLPASPAQLAEVADQSFQAGKAKVQELWEKTRIEEAIAIIRENASSVVVVHLLVLFTEAFGLQWKTAKEKSIEWFTPSPALYAHKVYGPDLSLLLTSGYWAPATLWALTNLFIPLVASYFLNLTLRTNTHHRSTSKTSRVDPLTFNIARALLAYGVYHCELRDGTSIVTAPGAFRDCKLQFGPFSTETVSTVVNYVPWNYSGLQIGSAIGILVSLYDAALKK